MAKAPDFSGVRRALLRWYARNGRPFPWRETRDPYRVLVSEIMLQQTRADRVASRFPEFLERYPDIESLAGARTSDVLRAWRGMGYNNRAVRLHGAVKEVVAKYGGAVPRDTADLEALPGIGRYTAHAVACFAHGRRVPVVDVNVRRVLSRIFRPMPSVSAAVAEQDAWDIARAVLPADAYNWHQALMDFGAMVCTARAPKCPACPVAGACLSAGSLRNAAAGGRAIARVDGRRRAHVVDPGHNAGRNPGPGPRRPEPSHLGVARRFWRGLLVDALRGSDGPRTLAQLRILVRPSGAAASVEWLADVVARLEKDGVVAVRRSRGRTTVALAS